MKHLSWLVTAAALAASSSASALGGLADVAIVDRDSGATLSTYYYRGEYWVAGNPGGRYAIEVRNRSGGPAAGGDFGRRGQRAVGRHGRLRPGRLRVRPR